MFTNNNHKGNPLVLEKIYKINLAAIWKKLRHISHPVVLLIGTHNIGNDYKIEHFNFDVSDDEYFMIAIVMGVLQ